MIRGELLLLEEVNLASSIIMIILTREIGTCGMLPYVYIFQLSISLKFVRLPIFLSQVHQSAESVSQQEIQLNANPNKQRGNELVSTA